jgi:hypothetical protein
MYKIFLKVITILIIPVFLLCNLNLAIVFAKENSSFVELESGQNLAPISQFAIVSKKSISGGKWRNRLRTIGSFVLLAGVVAVGIGSSQIRNGSSPNFGLIPVAAAMPVDAVEVPIYPSLQDIGIAPVVGAVEEREKMLIKGTDPFKHKVIPIENDMDLYVKSRNKEGETVSEVYSYRYGDEETGFLYAGCEKTVIGKEEKGKWITTGLLMNAKSKSSDSLEVFFRDVIEKSLERECETGKLVFFSVEDTKCSTEVSSTEKIKIYDVFEFSKEAGEDQETVAGDSMFLGRVKIALNNKEHGEEIDLEKDVSSYEVWTASKKRLLRYDIERDITSYYTDNKGQCLSYSSAGSNIFHGSRIFKNAVGEKGQLFEKVKVHRDGTVSIVMYKDRIKIDKDYVYSHFVIKEKRNKYGQLIKKRTKTSAEVLQTDGRWAVYNVEKNKIIGSPFMYIWRQSDDTEIKRWQDGYLGVPNNHGTSASYDLYRDSQAKGIVEGDRIARVFAYKDQVALWKNYKLYVIFPENCSNGYCNVYMCLNLPSSMDDVVDCLWTDQIIGAVKIKNMKLKRGDYQIRGSIMRLGEEEIFNPEAFARFLAEKGLVKSDLTRDLEADTTVLEKVQDSA